MPVPTEGFLELCTFFENQLEGGSSIAKSFPTAVGKTALKSHRGKPLTFSPCKFAALHREWALLLVTAANLDPGA